MTEAFGCWFSAEAHDEDCVRPATGDPRSWPTLAALSGALRARGRISPRRELTERHWPGAGRTLAGPTSAAHLAGCRSFPDFLSTSLRARGRARAAQRESAGVVLALLTTAYFPVHLHAARLSSLSRLPRPKAATTAMLSRLPRRLGLLPTFLMSSRIWRRSRISCGR